MRRLALPEYGRIHRWHSTTECPVSSGPEVFLEGHLFDRLERLEAAALRDDGEVFAWSRDCAIAQQWVGVIQVPGLQIEILPKVDFGPSDGTREENFSWVEARRNLLYMLAVAGHVPIRSRDVARLTTRRAPLLDALAALFAESLLVELLKGPEAGYVGFQESLRVFKGRLLVCRQVSENAAHRERFYCRFDEYSTDTPLNRAFKAACRHLLLWTRSAGTQDALRRCLLVLDFVAEESPVDADLKRVVFNRQNDRFSTLFDFARLVLSGQSPTARAGADRSFSLLFDMNKVFERFIAAFLASRVMPDLPGFRLFPQARHNRRPLFEIDGGGVALPLEPDLLVRHVATDRHFVLDTKWKRLPATGQEKGQGGVSNSDLYQLLAYAQRFGCAQSVLLYPAVPGVFRRDFHALDDRHERSGRRVSARFVNVNRDLCSEHERRALAEELRVLVCEGIGQAMAGESAEQTSVGDVAEGVA